MLVKVLFFGQLKDIVSRAEEVIELDGPATLETVFKRYASMYPRLEQMSRSIVLARNQNFAPVTAAVEDGDEIALLPPVSGGRGFTHLIEDEAGHFFALTREPIDSAAAARRVQQGSDGAVITFEGIVRDNTRGRRTRFLDYECYEAMAVRVMAEIGREIAAGHSVGRVAMIHRLGRLEIGEASVTVIVASPHRRAAFDAALEGINRLKKAVPIWKKEYFEDGEVWVEGDWDNTLQKASGGPA